MLEHFEKVIRSEVGCCALQNWLKCFHLKGVHVQLQNGFFLTELFSFNKVMLGYLESQLGRVANQNYIADHTVN